MLLLLNMPMVEAARRGVSYRAFQKLRNELPFTIQEWSKYLHTSDKTIQRYIKEQKTFAPPLAEKILTIERLYKRGLEVFGDRERFIQWMSSSHIALGNHKPLDLLDTSFGIELIEGELGRIEHGILA